ncbi:uncharacterized protein LOC120538776 [Polypterus senegalus]|uniref:uncharacterized protein LOC120538776 n=1 Tax=Polypterus senegalus TaxID=55291 RepID=UPI001964401D|nr:uncharacterized protein LOC120538776 [Polypterus senegalus]
MIANFLMDEITECDYSGLDAADLEGPQNHYFQVETESRFETLQLDGNSPTTGKSEQNQPIMIIDATGVVHHQDFMSKSSRNDSSDFSSSFELPMYSDEPLVNTNDSSNTAQGVACCSASVHLKETSIALDMPSQGQRVQEVSVLSVFKSTSPEIVPMQHQRPSSVILTADQDLLEEPSRPFVHNRTTQVPQCGVSTCEEGTSMRDPLSEQLGPSIWKTCDDLVQELREWREERSQQHAELLSQNAQQLAFLRTLTQHMAAAVHNMAEISAAFQKIASDVASVMRSASCPPREDANQ